ncbi:TetR/AcrR family transcriptional regulator [Winogradskya humida]|uniref:TetR family transcriptional regulator n=1 Tax=Winogradskya humida TaxID=113566 RepID=A0ABQ3ZRG7_9ACTN|nr:TetR/AcrR family transcriptional regulator [Actinoplanes humidus]GIE21149.1 TetR family transcriptional regulator [Actinoplanes humidus]
MPRVSEDHLNARREQILVAARACFMRKGVHNTTMQDLIHEAGLSVGAVYRYFKSKDEIINAISETVAGSLVLRLHAVAENETLSLIEAMGQVVDVIDEQARPGGNFPMGLQVWSEATLDPAIGAIVRDRFHEMRALFTTLAERAVARGEVAAGSDPDAVAAALFALMPGYAVQVVLTGSPGKEAYLAGLRALLVR